MLHWRASSNSKSFSYFFVRVCSKTTDDNHSTVRWKKSINFTCSSGSWDSEFFIGKKRHLWLKKAWKRGASQGHWPLVFYVTFMLWKVDHLWNTQCMKNVSKSLNQNRLFYFVNSCQVDLELYSLYKKAKLSSKQKLRIWMEIIFASFWYTVMRIEKSESLAFPNSRKPTSTNK